MSVGVVRVRVVWRVRNRGAALVAQRPTLFARAVEIRASQLECASAPAHGLELERMDPKVKHLVVLPEHILILDSEFDLGEAARARRAMGGRARGRWRCGDGGR